MLTMTKLASAIAKREGKKSQARIGDIREILKIIVTMEAEHIVDEGGAEDCPLVVLATEADAKAAKLKKKRKG